MAGDIPRGLKQLFVNVLNSSDVAGANVAVPGARGLNWNIESDSDTLEGDNQVIATVRNPKSLAGSIEIGRIALAALAAMVGGTVGSSGSTPNVITSLAESSASPTQYFQAVGNTPSQDATNAGYRATLKKLLATGGPNETMTVNEWNTPTIDFIGVAVADVLMLRQEYETYVALT